jgi:hypothetical protein
VRLGEHVGLHRLLGANSLAAISALERPRATSSRISRSRARGQGVDPQAHAEARLLAAPDQFVEGVQAALGHAVGVLAVQQVRHPPQVGQGRAAGHLDLFGGAPIRRSSAVGRP